MARDKAGSSKVAKHGPYLAVLQYEAVAASTAYVLVDLSDSTNFRHLLTNAIVLK